MRAIFCKINKCTLIAIILIACFTADLFAQQHSLFKVERTLSGKAKEFGEKNYLEYHVSMDNQKIYTVKVELDYDIPFPAFKVFDNGNGVLINAFDASFTFYNNSGSQIFRSKILKDFGVEYERSIYSAVSGEYIAISISNQQYDLTVVQIYNSLGQIISEWQLQEKIVDGISYSNKLDLLAISVHDWKQGSLNKLTIFLRSDGMKISKISYNYTHGFFVEKENVFFGFTNERLFVYDFMANKIKSTRDARPNSIILNAEFIDEKIMIIHTEKPFLENGRWYYKLLSFEGFDLKDSTFVSIYKRGKPFSEYQFITTKTGLKLKTENELIYVN